MRSEKLLILVLAFLLLFVVPGFALDFLYPATIERVIDGDTIVVNLDLGLGVVLDDQYIRFYGIDAWETRGEERPQGLQAKEYVIKRLKGGRVEIRIYPDWGSKGKGKYGRWLGIVYIDGKDLNVELIEQGHAEKYEEGES